MYVGYSRVAFKHCLYFVDICSTAFYSRNSILRAKDRIYTLEIVPCLEQVGTTSLFPLLAFSFYFWSNPSWYQSILIGTE